MLPPVSDTEWDRYQAARYDETLDDLLGSLAWDEQVEAHLASLDPLPPLDLPGPLPAVHHPVPVAPPPDRPPAGRQPRHR